MNVKKPRLVWRLDLEMFAIPPCKHDVICDSAQHVWAECMSSRATDIPTQVLFSYMTDKKRSGDGLKSGLFQKVAGAEYHVMSHGLFLRCALYSPKERLIYPWWASGCEGDSALLYVLLGLIKSWYALGICPLMRNMAINPVLALVVIGRLAETDWKASEDQKWFPYNYDESTIMELAPKLPLSCRSASGAKVREGEQLEAKPRYREEGAHRGMSINYA